MWQRGQRDASIIFSKCFVCLARSFNVRYRLHSVRKIVSRGVSLSATAGFEKKKVLRFVYRKSLLVYVLFPCSLLLYVDMLDSISSLYISTLCVSLSATAGSKTRFFFF